MTLRRKVLQCKTLRRRFLMQVGFVPARAKEIGGGARLPEFREAER